MKIREIVKTEENRVVVKFENGLTRIYFPSSFRQNVTREEFYNDKDNKTIIGLFILTENMTPTQYNPPTGIRNTREKVMRQVKRADYIKRV